MADAIRMKRMPLWILSVCMLFMFLLPAETSYAHASLIQASPSPNSHIDQSPKKIQLTFNERLEKELFWIKVLDKNGKKVNDHKAKMSKDQTKIYLDGLNLKKGTYTVSYHIISADGHPIESSYLITVGKATAGTAPETSSSHGHGSLSFFLLRGLYYFLLLGISGWIIWGLITRGKSLPEKQTESFWFKYLQWLFALAAIGMGTIELFEAVGSGFNLDAIGTALISTGLGLSIMVLCFLAVSGFALRQFIWFDILWVVVAMTAEALSGHAITFKPVGYTVILDVIHLLTAAIWVGGLLLISTHWTGEKVKDFLGPFSKGAMISLILLVITGILSTLAFLPALTDLFQTTWGILLLIKIGLVILVFAAGALIRRSIKSKSKERFRQRFKADFILMAAIIAIVGALTYSSPLPANEPLTWKKAQDSFTVVTHITPKNPGVMNQFTVEVASTEKPQYVKMNLTSLSNKSVAKIKVPLKMPKHTSDKGKTYTYQAKGQYFSLPGKWQIEIRILDQDDNETVIRKKTKIYQVRQ
ncbi:copper transport protein [Scopulibacillus darangshiensis]|uniref:Copper transport protein n=1 Tax=Scopulibacillus darangshiensis TaxID=442528 RepID=A0A4R2NF91_9BACL|nr:copper resistance protein CopC [Scopulibacillus darangshiensis]TCP19754.1 copper transport protein [Scopulibacillus darangshiensis]